MKIKLDTKKIYLAMAEKGTTITEIAKSVLELAVKNLCSTITRLWN